MLPSGGLIKYTCAHIYTYMSTLTRVGVVHEVHLGQQVRAQLRVPPIDGHAPLPSGSLPIYREVHVHEAAVALDDAVLQPGGDAQLVLLDAKDDAGKVW